MADTLLSAHDGLLFDLDGTVYHGTRVIPGAPEAVRAARDAGTPVRFVTNNASKAAEDVARHLAGIGVSAEPAEVSTSAQAAAKVLGERLAPGSRVLVVGTGSLADEVTAAGLTPVREAGDDVVAVVQGHSPDTGWRNLAEASVAIRAGALWVACNVDVTLPTERGLLPGNGSLVGALRAATGAEPVVAGKPASPLLDAAAESCGARRPLVIGDRLDTDIAGAVTAEMTSLCVLTGVATPALLLEAAHGERPDHLGRDLSALTEPVEQLTIGRRDGWDVRVDGEALRVRGDGGADELDLLRALCAVAWESGVTAVRAEGGEAEAALSALEIG
ncbi:HAD-IIA family hydrolase [Amycolatopsis minnesotensis]|uniref:HAD-IIA family hydrolase n=1 Tax=Amycolatopsis minnesotensis TaxID=337894 RepID=A0ABP5BFP7_9PSEU